MKRYRAVYVPPKFRRTGKSRNTRLGESVYFRFFSAYNLVYLKFFLMWVCCITLDFLIGFRFELLWPVWLLIRHLYESFRVHAFSSSLNYSAFSVFFVCVTATSDLVCYLFIPIQVLIFLASTYVWVQFVYQSSDRGACLPSLFLWALFIVYEYSVRYKFDNATWYLTRTSWITAGLFPSTAGSVSIGLSPNSSSSSSPSSTRLELYRPFAAHCIGFPVVTLGFRVKSFFSNWRMRVRRQEVTRQNEFFERLLADAIPTSFENRKHFISSRSHLTSDQDVIDYDVNAYNTSDLLLNGFDANNNNTSQQPQQPRLYSLLNNSWSTQITAICASPSQSYCGASSSSSSSIIQPQAQQYTSSITSAAVAKKPHQSMKAPAKITPALKHQNGTAALMKRSASSLYTNNNNIKLGVGAATVELIDNIKLSGGGGAEPSENGSKTGSAEASDICGSGYLQQQQTNQPEVDNTNNECSLLRENAQRLSEIRQLQKERQTLEGSFDKLKAELKSVRLCENELRLQLNSAQQREQSCREEWKQFEREQKQRMDQLESKCKQLGKQNDYYKLNTQALERRVGELQLKKSEIERELTNERLRNSARDDPTPKHQQNANENGEFKQKLACQDRELKTLRKDIKSKVEQLTKFDEELRQLRVSKSDGSKQMEIMRQKNFELEQKLSSENKLKQDLFRALNDSKAEIATMKARLHSKQTNLLQDGVMNAFRDTTGGTGNVLFQNNNNGSGVCTVGLNSSSGSSPTALQQQQRQFSTISQQKSLTPPPLSVGSSTFNSTLEQLLHATQNMSYSLSPLDSSGGGANCSDHHGGNAFNPNGMHSNSNNGSSSSFIGVAASEMLAVGGHRSVGGSTTTSRAVRDGSSGH